MCFSAEASFGVGVALIPAGVYCLWSSVLKKPTYLGLAAVPLFFGIQQISEGFVWRAIEAKDKAQTQTAALFFLFFALAFWPAWFPLLATLMEPQPRRRLLLGGISVLALSWFWILYYPLLLDPETLLTTRQVHHSIQYEYPDLEIYQYVARPWLRLLYLLSVALPLLLSSQRWGRIPGAVLGLSALLAALLFDHAFVSVWCFFAAVMAGYCCWVFHQLPAPSALPTPAQ